MATIADMQKKMANIKTIPECMRHMVNEMDIQPDAARRRCTNMLKNKSNNGSSSNNNGGSRQY